MFVISAIQRATDDVDSCFLQPHERIPTLSTSASLMSPPATLASKTPSQPSSLAAVGRSSQQTSEVEYNANSSLLVPLRPTSQLCSQCLGLGKPVSPTTSGVTAHSHGYILPSRPSVLVREQGTNSPTSPVNGVCASSKSSARVHMTGSCSIIPNYKSIVDRSIDQMQRRDRSRTGYRHRSGFRPKQTHRMALSRGPGTLNPDQALGTIAEDDDRRYTDENM